MKKLKPGDNLSPRPELFEAFIKLAQYIVRLKSKQDMLEHVGKFIAVHFPADWVAFVKPDGKGNVIITHCIPQSSSLAEAILSGDIRNITAGVLESGFLASDIIQAPGPYMAAFLPVYEGNNQEMVMLIGHKGESPVSKELLDIYLAIAGLVGATLERLKSESELNRHRAHLEEIVEERTAELSRAKAELERSNKDLEQFAYAASHDLREPLRIIAGFVQLLSRRYKGKLDADADEYIGFIVDGANRMSNLINDLLTYSRVAAAAPVQKISGNAALENALANLRAAIEENSASVTHGLLPEVYFNENRLAQIFQNLIGNAIKFHGDEPPRIHVCAEAAGGYWRFAVSDNGIGIAREQTDRIFEIFQRLHGIDKYPGTGIGLALCKRIVENRGGRIWVEPGPGCGSVFYFTVPEETPE